MLTSVSNILLAHVVDRLHHYYEAAESTAEIGFKGQVNGLNGLFVPTNNQEKLNLNSKVVKSLEDNFIVNNAFQLPDFQGHEVSSILKEYNVSNSWVKNYLEINDWHSFYPPNSQDILRDPNLFPRNNFDDLDEDYYNPIVIEAGFNYSMVDCTSTIGTMLLTSGNLKNFRLCYALRGSRARSGSSQLVYGATVRWSGIYPYAFYSPKRIFNFNILKTRLIAIVLSFDDLTKLYDLPSLRVYFDKRYICNLTGYGDSETGYPTVSISHAGIITTSISVRSDVILHAFCNNQALILLDVSKRDIVGDFSLSIEGEGFVVNEIKSINMEEYYELFR